MRQDNCSHIWEMVNVAGGLIVMKKCFHCSKVSTCFCFHNELPLEPCHEGEHFWNFMEGDPTFHFDLNCAKCNTLVKLDELVGLAMCTGCDQKCEAGILEQKLELEDTQLCIALGHRPINERKQLAPEKIAVLQEYFNQQNKSTKTRIKIVPHEMVRSFDNCYAEVIKDIYMFFTIPVEKK